MTTIWNGPQFYGDVQKELVKRFTKAGVTWVSAMRGHLNTAQTYDKAPSGKYHGHNPSLPGQFPHKLSGQLQKSMTYEVDQNKLVLTVGTNLQPYPAYLQTGTGIMKPRPWLSLGWELEESKVVRILTDG